MLGLHISKGGFFSVVLSSQVQNEPNVFFFAPQCIQNTASSKMLKNASIQAANCLLYLQKRSIQQFYCINDLYKSPSDSISPSYLMYTKTKRFHNIILFWFFFFGGDLLMISTSQIWQDKQVRSLSKYSEQIHCSVTGIKGIQNYHKKWQLLYFKS